MKIRQRINDNPLLAPALKWNPEDDTLSSSEAALARIVHTLTTDLEALDADHQLALEDLTGQSVQRRWRSSRRVFACSTWVVG